MDCKYCNNPIRPGQSRTPVRGGVFHDWCGIRTSGKTEDWLFYCHDCEFATDRLDVIQACPRCDSAKSDIVPPAEYGAWSHGPGAELRVCPGCLEPFEYQNEWTEHDCG